MFSRRHGHQPVREHRPLDLLFATLFPAQYRSVTLGAVLAGRGRFGASALAVLLDRLRPLRLADLLRRPAVRALQRGPGGQQRLSDDHAGLLCGHLVARQVEPCAGSAPPQPQPASTETACPTFGRW